MNRISRKSLSRRKRRSLGRRSKVSRRSQRRRSRVSRRRSRCNSRRLKRSCKRGKKCSWVKRKSSGRRKHRGYCKQRGGMDDVNESHGQLEAEGTFLVQEKEAQDTKEQCDEAIMDLLDIHKMVQGKCGTNADECSAFFKGAEGSEVKRQLDEMFIKFKLQTAASQQHQYIWKNFKNSSPESQKEGTLVDIFIGRLCESICNGEGVEKGGEWMYGFMSTGLEKYLGYYKHERQEGFIDVSPPPKWNGTWFFNVMRKWEAKEQEAAEKKKN